MRTPARSVMFLPRSHLFCASFSVMVTLSLVSLGVVLPTAAFLTRPTLRACDPQPSVRRRRQVSVRIEQQVVLGRRLAAQREEDGEREEGHRTRKRDILKRALGLGNSKEEADSSPTERLQEIPFRKAGVIPPLPNLVSLDEEAQLNATYAQLRETTLEKLAQEFQSNGGEFFEKESITEEEARQIVEYALEEERVAERTKLNEQKCIEMLEKYDRDAQQMEEEMVMDILSQGEDHILERDAVAREIIMDYQGKAKQELEDAQRLAELREYEKELCEKEEEIANARTKEILNKYSDPNLDADQVYDEVLAAIQTSRRDKLGKPSFGVLANSIALEEARKSGIKVKEVKERQKAAREEAISKGYCNKDGLDLFFQEPKGYVEIKRYQEIITSLVNKRPPRIDANVSEAKDMDNGDGENEEGDDEANHSYTENQEEFELTTHELVESFRLLNLWRDFEAERIKIENSIETKKPRSSNKIEPLFLYIEDSEQTRQEEKDEFAMALKLGLQTDDSVDKSSNDLLMKELLDGGVTKDRSLRLIDKLISKTSDVTIKSALEDFKRTLLEDEEKVVITTPNKPEIIDMSKVFLRNEYDEIKPRAKKVKDNSDVNFMSSRSEDEEMIEEEGLLEEDNVSPPTFFQSPNIIPKGKTSSMFGTYEEQLFQRFAAQTGATTEEQKESLRKNLDNLREMQKKAYLELDDEEQFDITIESQKLGVNVSSLNLDNDNDDQIISIIEKRPIIRSSNFSENSTTASDDNEAEDIIIGSDGKLKKIRDDKKLDIAGAQYRAISAGITDKETRRKDEAAFRDYLKYEQEMMKKLDETSDEALPADFDIDQYAEDVMSEIKPRPQIRKRDDFVSIQQLQEERKKEFLYGQSESANDEIFEKRDSPVSNKPDWLRVEQEGRETKSRYFDNDDNDDRLDEVKRQIEIEERQRLADEYLEQQSGGAIDIEEVLGRNYFGSMDDPEDYKKRYSAFSSFQARKDELLKYTTLTVSDIVNVVEWKTDPAITGANRYLAQIQRPFSEFGALFRLEGCIVDTFGMQAKAWKKVAETHGYTIYSEEDLRRASLYKPSRAVRFVFGWTDDVIELEAIAKSHHLAFNEAFNAWMENDRSYTKASESGATLNYDVASKSPKPTKEEINATYQLAWMKLARRIGKNPPSEEEVIRGISTRDWEIAVRDVFGWTEYTTSEIYDIVVDYDVILQEDYKALYLKYGIKIDEDTSENSFADLSFQDGVTNWLDLLRSVEMPFAIISNLESYQLDIILNVTGLGEYFPPEKRVSADDNYGDERSEVLGAALRVEQRPDRCILFDNTPSSANVAHDILMKCISFVNHYPKYELVTADWTVAGYENLDLTSIRTLFMERTDNVPLAQVEYGRDLNKQLPRVQTSFWEEGDR